MNLKRIDEVKILNGRVYEYESLLYGALTSFFPMISGKSLGGEE